MRGADVARDGKPLRNHIQRAGRESKRQLVLKYAFSTGNNASDLARLKREAPVDQGAEKRSTNDMLRGNTRGRFGGGQIEHGVS